MCRANSSISAMRPSWYSFSGELIVLRVIYGCVAGRPGACLRHATTRANVSISAMRLPCFYLLEEIVILGVIYGSLMWRVCNPAAPARPQGIPGLSPDVPRCRAQNAFKSERIHTPNNTFCRCHTSAPCCLTNRGKAEAQNTKH